MLKFDIYADKDIKVGLCLRETGTTAAIGANGGTTGAIEWVGVPAKNGTAPNPVRTVTAGAWTTVRYNIPFQAVTAFTGNGTLESATAKGVLEHLALVPAGGLGTYNIYLDNFVYVRDNNLTFSLDAAPAGAAIDPITGLFSWTPAPGQAGTHTVTVRVTDNGSPRLSTTRSFTITVNPANNKPVLTPIPNKSVNEGDLLAFTATATHPDATRTITFSLDPGAPVGAAINPATGQFSWTPTEAQGPGSYRITVRATDNAVPPQSDVKSFTVTVNELNLAPALDPLANRAVDEMTPLSFIVTASDPDLPANGLSFSLELGAPAGATIDPESGEFSWTPTEAQGPGTYNLTARVTDSGAPPLSATRSLAVTVKEVNTPPLLAPLPDRRVRPGRTVAFTASATDADLPVNPLTFSLAPGAPAAASINPTNGAFTWTPTRADNGTTNTITVRVSDGAASADRPFTVVVSDVNNPPVLATITNRVVNEKTLLTFSVTAADPDDDPLSFSLDAGAPAGAAINPTNGAFAWTPSEAQGPGTYTLTVRVTDHPGDGRDLSATNSFTVTVNEVNLPPALTPIANKSVAEKTTLTFTATASDADIPANTKTFSLDTGAPAGASIHPNTGVFTWTPTEAHGPGVYPITIRVTDNNPDAVNNKQMSDAKLFTVTVHEVNEPPAITPVADKAIAEKSPLAFYIFATDPDLPANKLTFSLADSPPAGVALDPNSGLFTWTPPEAQGPSTNLFTVRVTDNSTPPLEATRSFTVVVQEVNEAPVLAALANRTIAEGSTLAFTATATDPNTPANALTFSLVSAPAGASIDPVSGAFTWTPTGAQAPSTNTIALRVTDNGAPPLSDTKSFVVIVTSPNAPPVLNPIANKTVDELTTLSFTATATDPEANWTPVNFADFESYAAPTVNGTVMFRHPAFSSTSSGFINAGVTNYTKVVDTFPAGHAGAQVLRASWSFPTSTTNPWLRLSTYSAANQANPIVDFNHLLRFDLYADKAIKLGLCLRETSSGGPHRRQRRRLRLH